MIIRQAVAKMHRPLIFRAASLSLDPFLQYSGCANFEAHAHTTDPHPAVKLTFLHLMAYPTDGTIHSIRMRCSHHQGTPWLEKKSSLMI